MSDLPGNINTDDVSSSSVKIIPDQMSLNLNNSINETFHLNDHSSTPSYEMMRILFLAIATITVLICLTICLTVCICICLKRKRKSKQRDNKDQLLPEQSRKPSKISSNNPTTTNGKQGSSLPQTSTSSSKTPIKPFYYDNLDDIPFIDESRPTSVVDITQV